MPIKLEKITKVYSGSKTPVIENLDLTIQDRTFTVLLGPSGCGKTTLLRMIAGLEDVTSGQISVDGKEITGMQPGDRNLAMVYQNYAIYPHMTVRGNIEFGLKNYKMTKDEIKERIEAVLEVTGLTEFADRMPNQLSGGQRQRVALARAISKSPQAFLMDEPLSNLDAKLRTQMRSELIQLYNQMATTFIYVTHDQTEDLTMATDIVVMRLGKIMQQASPKELYTNPANVFVAQFIGDPGMNVLQMADGHFLGFRPRSIHFKPQQGDIFAMQGKVLTSEYLGYDYQITLNVGLGKILARSQEVMAVGSDCTLYVNGEDLYYFDNNQNRCESFDIKEPVGVYHADE